MKRDQEDKDDHGAGDDERLPVQFGKDPDKLESTAFKVSDLVSHSLPNAIKERVVNVPGFAGSQPLLAVSSVLNQPSAAATRCYVARQSLQFIRLEVAFNVEPDFVLDVLAVHRPTLAAVS